MSCLGARSILFVKLFPRRMSIRKAACDSAKYGGDGKSEAQTAVE